MYRISISFTICSIILSIAASVTGQSDGNALPDLMISSKDSYWESGTYTNPTTGTATYTVDETLKHQYWEGFGGTFNEMGWDALSVVSPEIPRAMELLFDDENGANFVYGRIPMGASDYAMSWYTLAETANDYQMNNFSIARDGEKLIPYIKAALEVNPDLHLWGSPWICPDWMKNGMNFKTDTQTMEAYALYFAKFVEEYGKAGITIEAVHHQNEPGYGQVKWTIPQFVSFLRDYLGPKFEERTISTEVWCGTMSHPDDSLIAIACMNDDDAMQYIVGFGLQWNHETTVATLSQKGRVWQTEHRCGNYNFATKYWDQAWYNSSKPQNDHRYGVESWRLLRDWIAAGVNAYNAWNMVLDTYGKSLHGWPQNALLVVDRQAKQLIITPAYWTFRHFSQYIKPGAYRVEVGGGADILAFLNPDGNIITQVCNTTDTLQQPTIKVAGMLYKFDLPSQSWATLSVNPTTGIKKHSLQRAATTAPRITATGKGYRITLASAESGTVELLSASGRILMSEKFTRNGSEVFLPAETIPRTGLVLLRITHGAKRTVSRLVITH
jgi:glucosylceramidase